MEFDLHELPSRQALTKLAVQFPELNVPSVETFLLLLRTATDAFKKVSTNLSHFGITSGRMMVLISIFNTHHDMSPSELAERIGVTRATISGLLDGLEREGLIERFENPDDRRMSSIHLTEKGSQLLSNMLPSHFQQITDIMKLLDENEFTLLIQLLTKIRTQCLKKNETHS